MELYDPAAPQQANALTVVQVILRQSLTVGVDHDEANAARLRGLDEVDDLRMNGRLASRELHHFWRALSPDEIVQHGLDFLERQAEAGACGGEAQRAVHVAHAVDLDDPQTRVLLVIRAQSTVVGTTLLELAAKGQRDRPRLVVLAVGDIRFRVAVDESLERAAGRTAF